MAKAGISDVAAPGAGSAMLQQATADRRDEFAQTIMTRALELFRNGQLDSADVLLETMEQEQLVRPRVLHFRGLIALQLGEDERALDFLEEAIRLDPADGDAHANLGALLLKARQFQQALAAYASALSLQPAIAGAQFGLARALAASGLPDLAIDAFRDVLAIAPDLVEAAAELTSLLEASGEHHGAAVERDPPQAAERATTGSGMTDPVMAAALRMTAAPHAAEPVLCDALFVEACRHHRQGDLQRSKRVFERILAIDPGHVNTLCNLGSLELSQARVQRAQTLLQSAVTLAPELAPARIAFADALMAAGKIEQAQKQYQRALELAPASDAAHAQYAIALSEVGDLDGAMTHFLAAAKISQQQSPQFYEALGRVNAARGNAKGAEISLEHALALDPRRASAHCALGELWIAIDRAADADAAFHRALAIDPGNAAALRGIERTRSLHPLDADGAS
jgi:tetratricopeptide (TPR) repeat protein